jgi:pyruvate/2-oxoglutarate dehydrogenase complex dihydrolipoamide dehydrogenase (E3) component
VAGNLLRFRHAVIATGARPNRPPIPGLDEAGYLTNETIFALTQLPARLAVIGAGPVGCELAQAFARLGSRVTLYSREARLLPRDDAEAAALVEHALVGDGVVVRHLCRVERITRSTSRDKIIHCVVGNQSVADAVDAILIGVGRRPNVRNLGLESAGVAYDEREGVRVDDRLRTTQRRIFAAGDVCSRFQFTHAADAMARIVIQNACFLGRARASLLTVPWCTYTDPEIAHVGLSEADAAARGLSVTTFTQRMNAVDRSVLDGEPDGFVKVHVRTGTDRLVGATIVARHAGEMISELTLAMVGGLGMRTVARTIHPYPTRSEAIKKTADAYNRARLTPFVQNLLRRWFTWRP